jgi:hypothetical protein
VAIRAVHANRRSIEQHKPVWPEITAPNCRQHGHGHHRDPADPDHDGEKMEGPSAALASGRTHALESAVEAA